MSIFKNKRGILCLLVAAILFTCCSFSTFGSSAMSAWAEDEVNEAISLGLIPDDMQENYIENITRAEFCRLTVVLLEKIYDSTIDDILAQRDLTINNKIFTDTQDKEILAANALGIVFGDGKGIFNPGGEIKRGEAAAMLMRTASLTGEYSALPHVFDDAAWFPAWARESAYEAYAYGIMVGDNMNRFHPVNFYTRQETYATILRLYHTIQNGAKEKETLYPMSLKSEEGHYLWGYIKQNGVFVIEPKYAYAGEWNGQYGIVSLPDNPNAYFVIDREENHVAKESYPDYGLFICEKPPHFLGNTLYVENSERNDGHYLYSLPDGRWLTGDYKGGGASKIIDGIIRAYDSFSHVVYYLDRNGQPVIPREEGYFRGGDFYRGATMVENAPKNEMYLWEAGVEKKLDIDFEKRNSFMAIGDLMAFTKLNSARRELYGVIRADGKEILPSDYETLSLTPSKQILAQKNTAEPYSLFDESGQAIYEFDLNFDRELQFDNIGHYMFRSRDTMLTVISNTGSVMTNIEIPQDAKFRFINGLVQVIEADGVCRYYTVNGNTEHAL